MRTMRCAVVAFFLWITPALVAPVHGVEWKWQNLPNKTVKTVPGVAASPSQIVCRFFDEAYMPGGFQYAYPEQSKVFIAEGVAKTGEVSLQFNLDPADYSGGAVCLFNMVYDLKPYFKKGELQFWIKGADGNEIAWIALVDDEKNDMRKTVVRLPSMKYCGIAKEWTLMRIPLCHFGLRGVYWDPKRRIEVPEDFDWDKVAEFRIEVKKKDNKSFRVWADDIFVVKDAYDPSKDSRRPPSGENLAPHPAGRDPVKTVASFFTDNLPEGGFAYTYGGSTAYSILPSTDLADKGILAMYQDNSEYSGVSIALGAGKSIDLAPLRSSGGGIAFWAKAGPGVSKAVVGLLDLTGDGRKVQTRLPLQEYGTLDTTWRYYMIPLKEFSSNGLYWDERKQAEIAASVDWKNINEIRFSINKGENAVAEGSLAEIFADDIDIIERVPGFTDPDEYWKNFSSTAPDLVLHDFETPADSPWVAIGGPNSKVSCMTTKRDDVARRGNRSLSITYTMNDWCDVVYDYASNASPLRQRDWSNYRGLRFSLYTDKPYQSVSVQVADKGNELFFASAGGRKGWNEIHVPFKDFKKFPYYQPPGATQNRMFDRDGVISLDFKAGGAGTSGTFLIDNVVLTNARTVTGPAVVPEVTITLSGRFDSAVSARINGGIFGINAALWDARLLDNSTISPIKSVNHGIIRYPGGLRADVDHWRDVLSKKDRYIDTDEFLEFCKKTGTEPMITANFGNGTPQEAADWVAYCNHTLRAGVKLWEIGNELYGSWHPKHCSADDYGKKAAEFIRAMKAVDPSIKIAVIWELAGEWNKKTFEYTRTLADAVVLHHYPQEPGEENDAGLLSSPQNLDALVSSARRQLREYGEPGKTYELWLTEWNSVSSEPGLQSISAINGLFVIDYLGMLARGNVDRACYWDIHNSITARGGDYGYLSTSDAPEGANVPRPSYWAFQLASRALRGRLYDCRSGDENVSAYCASTGDGVKSLILINKYPSTKAAVTFTIPGLKGKAKVVQYGGESAARGLSERTMTLGDAGLVTLQPYQAVSITVKEE